ncbi:carbohydrate-binding domain-containing protein [Glutamicibacter sp. TV12E]|uniref:carbohydrate-binding domain-containing protein n=1 Tax=Glutamicibacter sp. TV12E TaxID=3446362 RepID=UPI0040345264
MKRTFKVKALSSVAALSLALAMTGCASSGSGTTVSDVINATSSSSSADTAAENASSASGDSTIPATDLSEDTHFDEDDLQWDADKETKVGLSDGSTTASGTDSDSVSVDEDTVTISAAGTYRLSGSLSDGKVVVAAGKEDVIRIILDNTSISSSAGSAIQVDESNEALLYLEDGTSNSVSDASTYADTAEDAANAAIYSMADLTIAGEGSLDVKGNYQDGIVSKDGLVLASGQLTVTSADDGIKGKDYVALLGGKVDITASGDGIKSTNDTDADRGWVHQYGGQLNVSAGDDGIKAEQLLTLSGGAATVTKSNEGLQAPTINLTGATVNVTASDDGVNATAGSSENAAQGGGGAMDAAQDAHLNISGGKVAISAEGDGLDSNGDISITGGTTIVNGPTNGGNGALDSNGEISVDGGVLFAAGSDGMAEGLGETSKQSGVQASLGTSVDAGVAIHIVDSSGSVIASFVTSKATSNVVYSSSEIVDGDSYSIYTGGTADVDAGLGTGSITDATKVATATAGEFDSGMGGQGGGPGGQ